MNIIPIMMRPPPTVPTILFPSAPMPLVIGVGEAVLLTYEAVIWNPIRKANPTTINTIPIIINSVFTILVIIIKRIY